MTADHQHADLPHGPELLMHLLREHPEVEINRVDGDLVFEEVHRAAHAPTPDLWLAGCDSCTWRGDYPTSRAQAQRDQARHIMREHSPGRAD